MLQSLRGSVPVRLVAVAVLATAAALYHVEPVDAVRPVPPDRVLAAFDAAVVRLDAVAKGWGDPAAAPALMRDACVHWRQDAATGRSTDVVIEKNLDLCTGWARKF